MKKVLVLHSERHIGRLIQVNLDRQGIEVTVASTATRAIELVHDERSDAILADRWMRFLDGFDVFRSLRKHPSTADIPIYIVPPADDRGTKGLELPLLREWTDEDDETPQ